MKITKNEFGMTKDNQPISLYTIENASGASVTLSDYGCRIIKIMVPNKEGKLTDVILGLMNADEYLADDASLGAVVGRCANRIAKGHFTLNDKEYNLAINNGPNHLHGGPTGFAQRVWTGKVTDDKVTFTRISPDGEEGYPGNLTVSVTYGWSEDNELSIVYEASCDQDTVFSVTSHGYFNLNGEGNGTVLDQELRIDADAITELNDKTVAKGTKEKVEEAQKGIEDGTIHVFDTSTFTVDGKELDSWKDDNGNEYIKDGYFHESELHSAPAFAINIDGIESVEK